MLIFFGTEVVQNLYAPILLRRDLLNGICRVRVGTRRTGRTSSKLFATAVVGLQEGFASSMMGWPDPWRWISMILA